MSSWWTRWLLLSLVFLGACDAHSTPATPAENRASESVLWRPVGSWSGRGNGQTGSFSVETGALRLRWEALNESPLGTGTFRVSLHSAISGRPLQIAVDHRGAGRDTTYIEDDPRMSYLVVDSQNLDWALTLEEAVPGTAAGEPTKR